MSLYLGTDRVVPTFGESNAWWGGKDVTFLYEANYECKLSQTDWADKTPSSTQQSVKYPINDYQSTSDVYIYFDKYGSGFHEMTTTPLNFKKYRYFVVSDGILDIAYTGDESTMGLIHPIRFAYEYLYEFCPRATVVNSVIAQPDENNIRTIATSVQGTYFYLYRKANNTIDQASNTYGMYLSPVAPALQTTSSFNPTWIGFRTPYWYFRSHNSYCNLSAFDSINAENTKLKLKARLYQTGKNCRAEVMYYRMENMLATNSFQTNAI